MRAKEIVRQIRAALPEGVDLVEFLPTLCDSLKLIKVKMAQPVGAVHPFPFSQAVKPELDLRATTKALKKEEPADHKAPTHKDEPSPPKKGSEYTPEESAAIDRLTDLVKAALPWGSVMGGIRIGAHPVTKKILLKEAWVTVYPYYWNTSALRLTIGQLPGTGTSAPKWTAAFKRRRLDLTSESIVTVKGDSPAAVIKKALQRFEQEISGANFGNPPIPRGLVLVGRRWLVIGGEAVTKTLTFRVPGSPDYHDVDFIKEKGKVALTLTRKEPNQEADPSSFFTAVPVPLNEKDRYSLDKVMRKILSFKNLQKGK